jgi:glucokinase
MKDKKIAIGVDIGGSHITCRLVDIVNNVFVGDQIVRKHVNSQGTKEEIISAWCDALAETAADVTFDALAGIGFAMPGPFDYPAGIGLFEGVLKFDSLNGVNVRQEIKDRLGLKPDFAVRFLNDASCFAIGESLFGKASHHHRLLAITLGTGFGTTFIREHRPIAGEDGLTDDGFLYYVLIGDRMADEYFSTRWFINEYKRLTSKDVSGVKELSALYQTDKIVQDIFHTFGKNLGTFLSPWLANFGATALVIGGNISGAYAHFGGSLQQCFDETGLQITIYISELQENAALCGSAALCDDKFYNQLTN